MVKVKLRQKPISGGKLSLYLDIYPPVINRKTGKPSRREFLHQFIHAPIAYKTKKTKNGTVPVPVYPQEHEVEILNTLDRAEGIRRARENELNKQEIYSVFELEQLKKIETGNRNFVTYFKEYAEKKSGTNRASCIASYKYLDKFTSGTLKFSAIDAKVCNDFANYLLTTKSNKSSKVTLSKNSAAFYFNKFMSAVKEAGLLSADIRSKIDYIKEKESTRNFLTFDEMNKLIRTDCTNPVLKKAAIFSALTGLRFSDIQKLTWKEVSHNEEQGHIIAYSQKKTDSAEVLPISEQAVRLIGSPGAPDSRVFEGLEYSAYANKHLYQWIGAAGITKEITFHCFRHTYASLLISKGTDIYIVSKMLGHKSVKTTQVYAKVLDKSKRDAADKINFDELNNPDKDESRSN